MTEFEKNHHSKTTSCFQRKNRLGQQLVSSSSDNSFFISHADLRRKISARMQDKESTRTFEIKVKAMAG